MKRLGQTLEKIWSWKERKNLKENLHEKVPKQRRDLFVSLQTMLRAEIGKRKKKKKKRKRRKKKELSKGSEWEYEWG